MIYLKVLLRYKRRQLYLYNSIFYTDTECIDNLGNLILNTIKI